MFAAPGGSTLVSPAAEQAVGTSLRNAAQVPGVIDVADPYQAGKLSASKTIGYADVLFGPPGQNVSQSARNRLIAAMAAEVDAYIAQFTSERDENGRRVVVRNGHHQPREVLTSGRDRGEGTKGQRQAHRPGYRPAAAVRSL